MNSWDSGGIGGRVCFGLLLLLLYELQDLFSGLYEFLAFGWQGQSVVDIGEGSLVLFEF